jgi:hypothetical protein
VALSTGGPLLQKTSMQSLSSQLEGSPVDFRVGLPYFLLFYSWAIVEILLVCAGKPCRKEANQIKLWRGASGAVTRAAVLTNTPSSFKMNASAVGKNVRYSFTFPLNYRRPIDQDEIRFWFCCTCCSTFQCTFPSSS